MGGGLCRKIPRYGQVPEDAPGWKKKSKQNQKNQKQKQNKINPNKTKRRWILFPYSINIFRDENWENDAYKILSLVSPDEEGNTGVLINDNEVSPKILNYLRRPQVSFISVCNNLEKNSRSNK